MRMYKIFLGATVMIMAAGLIVFAIGARKAVKSKYNDLDAILWCIIGQALVVFATAMAKYL